MRDFLYIATDGDVPRTTISGPTLRYFGSMPAIVRRVRHIPLPAADVVYGKRPAADVVYGKWPAADVVYGKGPRVCRQNLHGRIWCDS